MTRNHNNPLPGIAPSLFAALGLLFLLAPPALAEDPYIGVNCSWNYQVQPPVDGGQTEPEPIEPCSATAPLSSGLYDFSLHLLSFGGSLYEYDSFTDQETGIETRTYYLNDGDRAICRVWFDEMTSDEFRECDYQAFSGMESYTTTLNIDCVKEDYGEGDASCRIAADDSALTSGMDNPPPGNQLSVLDSFILSCYGDSPSPFCGQLMDALAGVGGDANSLIQSLLPLDPEMAMDMSHASQRGAAGAIQQRLTRLRSGNTLAGDVQTRLFLADNQWLEAGTLLAAADNTATDAAPARLEVDRNISDFGRLGLFVNASVIDGRYDAGSLSGRSDAESATVTIGVDYRFGDNLVAGLAGNFGQSKVQYKTTVAGELEADNYALIGYTSWYRNNWYVDGALTLGVDHYEQLRDPAVNNSFESKYKGSQYDLSGTVGYEFVINRFNVSPHIKLSAGRLDTDAYSEKKTSPDPGNLHPAGIEIDKQKRDTGSISAGSHFRYVFTTSRGVFIPLLTLTAVHDYETEAQQVTGRFTNLAASTSSFQIDTEETDSTYYVIAAGCTFQLKNGNAGFVNLETLEGYDNLDQQRLTLGWRWEL